MERMELENIAAGAVFGLVLGYLFAAHVSDDTIRILIGLGIWLIKVVPTAQFFRITYVLLFVLGSVLFCQGTAHMLRETSLFDLALNNPARINTSLSQPFSQSVAL
jgi:hypothetical protein